jgi:hypothetical protein
MNNIIKIILLTIFFAVSANVIFGQSATPTPTVMATDDSDGDGVKNSEDLCPNDKGTLANKGCPGKDDQKRSNETPKKQDSIAKVELVDSATSPRPQNNNQVGSFADCKYILSDGCRNYFYQSGIDVVVKQLNIMNPKNWTARRDRKRW